MSKHTPGPWEARYTPSRALGADDVWCVDWSSDQEEVAEIVHGEANARLIAAAPELLEVVQKFVAWSEAERDPSGTTFWQRVEMCREVDALTSAAIAKTTGEQA